MAEAKDLRMLYIGAVSLLLRCHRKLDRKSREEFDAEGGLERLAADFNAQGFHLRMERHVSGWCTAEGAGEEGSGG